MPKSKSSSKFSRIISGREKQPDPHTGSSSSKKRRLGKDPESSLSLPSLSGLTVDDLSLEPPINLISDEKNKKLDILNKQNLKIINKIDKLSSLVESLEDRLANIEEKIEDIKDNMYEMRTKSDDKTDGTFVNRYIKDIAKRLLNDSIYPTKEEYLVAANTFLSDEFPKYFESFTEKQWEVFYTEKIHRDLVSKHRSLRGTLTARVKEAVFSIFGEANLPNINTNTSPDDIRKWKIGPAAYCRKRLFEPLSSLEPDITYMSKILEKVWADPDKVTNISIAFAISVCDLLLNPKNQNIQINEDALKATLKKNLNKIEKRTKFAYVEDKGESDNSTISLSDEELAHGESAGTKENEENQNQSQNQDQNQNQNLEQEQS